MLILYISFRVDHLQKWLDGGHRLLIFLIIPTETKFRGGILDSPCSSVRPSVRSSVRPKSLLRSQIYHGYEELSTDTNYPIWRRQKLPYMKKTRKKKQVCGAACFMAAEIKFSEDVRLWVGVRMITLILYSGFKNFFLHISLGSRSCMGLNISILPH